MNLKSHATLRYTSMRATCFIVVFVIAMLLAHFNVLPVTAGASGVLLIAIIAAVISAPISYVLLSKQRDAMSQQIAEGIEARRASGKPTLRNRIAQAKAEEDAIDDALRTSDSAHSSASS